MGDGIGGAFLHLNLRRLSLLTSMQQLLYSTFWEVAAQSGDALRCSALVGTPCAWVGATSILVNPASIFGASSACRCCCYADLLGLRRGQRGKQNVSKVEPQSACPDPELPTLRPLCCFAATLLVH